MAPVIRTSVYLEPEQKAALAREARAKRTSLSVEVRCAIDVYLAGLSAQELCLLDEATREAESEIEEMKANLDRASARARRFFKEIERLRGGIAP